MNKLKEQLQDLISQNAKTNWLKGIYWALLVCFFLFLASNIYLLFKPISSDVKEIIDEELKSSNVSFDQKTIDALKARKGLNSPLVSPTGKNPFTGL